MKKVFYFLLVSFILSSCSKRGIRSNSGLSPNEKGAFYKLNLKANNLSEDANILSTHNDELILLVYSNLSREYPKLIVQEEFVIDSIGTSKMFKIRDRIIKEEKLLFVFIEIDTEKKLEGIIPILNSHWKVILEANKYQDLQTISEYLGDDDLLAIEKISLKDFIENDIRIQGIHLFDAYDYLLEIQN